MKIYRSHNISHNISKLKVKLSRIEVEVHATSKAIIFTLENKFRLALLLAHVPLHGLYILITKTKMMDVEGITRSTILFYRPPNTFERKNDT